MNHGTIFSQAKQFKPRYLFHVPVYVEDMETEKVVLHNSLLLYFFIQDFNAVEGALINVKVRRLHSGPSSFIV